jgi:hypothetical protein
VDCEDALVRARLPASRQFDLYVDTADYDGLASEITAAGGIVCTSKGSSADVSPAGREAWRPAARLLALPEATLGNVRRRDPHGRGTWILTPGVDPVVEVWLSGCQGRQLRPGRVYFAPMKATHGLYVPHPDAVQELADALFVRIKKWAVTWHGQRCGPATALKLEAEDLHL